MSETTSTSTTPLPSAATLSMPTIEAIRQLAVASAPAAAIPFINAQFAGASAASSASASVPVAVPAASSVAVPALAQPTISFIREQILANAPSAYASAIAEQFTASTASASTAAPVAPVQPATSDVVGADSSAVGASLAAPAIAFVRQQIALLAPAEYSASILAQFPATPVASSASLPAPQTAGAVVSTSTAISDIQAYLTA